MQTRILYFMEALNCTYVARRDFKVAVNYAAARGMPAVENRGGLCAGAGRPAWRSAFPGEQERLPTDSLKSTRRHQEPGGCQW